MEKIAEKIIKNNKKNDKFKQNMRGKFAEKQSFRMEENRWDYEIYHVQKRKLMQIR